MFEVVMKRFGDEDFVKCSAFSMDQPYSDRCTFETEKKAKSYVAKMNKRHGSAVEWKIIPFNLYVTPYGVKILTAGTDRKVRLFLSNLDSLPVL